MTTIEVAGFAKFRQEILRENDLYRALANLEKTCDGGVLCDDASTDGSQEVLQDFVQKHPTWRLLTIDPREQDFSKEIAVKQRMMAVIHEIKPQWIWWLDGDEVLSASGTANLRTWIRDLQRVDPQGQIQGYRFHYTQLWRNTQWARTDGGFDDGKFIKLWRYSPGLSFEVKDGTHQHQFPQQIEYGTRVLDAPFEVLHYGNVGKNLIWKALQYSGGRGGVDRHISFGHKPTESLASASGFDHAHWSEPNPTYRRVNDSIRPPEAERIGDDNAPQPFTLDEIKRIRSMQGLKDLKGWFTVIIPAFNRAKTLPKALKSLLEQTYDKWIAVVLDDSSTDNTQAVMRVCQDMDPRIFYARYPVNRGGVAMNEIGMALAVEMTEFWTRLGSDDWFGPRKLERDAQALQNRYAVYGPYTVVRGESFGETCNPEMTPEHIRKGLLACQYYVGWANAAARTSLLKAVKERFGHFCDPGLRNMEDFIFNARVASLADWVYRKANPGEIDAIWNCAPEGGASSPDHAKQMDDDQKLTYALIQQIGVQQPLPPIQAAPQPTFVRTPVFPTPIAAAKASKRPYVKQVVVIPANLEYVRKAWTRAAEFPANKEDHYPEHQIVQEFDKLAPETKVLEYGCGGGSDAMSFLRRKCDVTYVDVVESNVEAARKRIELAELGPATGIALDTSAVIPLADDQFDVASSHGVIHHIEDPVPVLQEIRRVLKPGGFFYCMLYTEHLYARHVTSMKLIAAEYKISEAEAFCWCTDGYHSPYARAYTEKEGRELLEKSGFEPLSAIEYNNGAFRTFKARTV